jgi:hypothetical protein
VQPKVQRRNAPGAAAQRSGTNVRYRGRAITRETVDDFFRETERRGARLNRKMLWGYFFTDADRARLEKVREELETLGYRFVDYLERDAGETDSAPLYLHVERIEQHTAASLFSRCKELAKLAASHDIESFDGFDLGNVDGTALYH